MNKHHSPLRLQIMLCIVLACIGFFLTIGQYSRHQEAYILEHESNASLVQILKNASAHHQELGTELQQLKSELTQIQKAIDNGESLHNSTSSRINTLPTALGVYPVYGSGLIISIPQSPNLVYQDIIDLTNELMNSGAEAISINDVRFCLHTHISEEIQFSSIGRDDYVITIDGQEVSYPLVLKVTGNADTLETALTYPGGVIDNLNSLYAIYPVIRHSNDLQLPAAQLTKFIHCSPIDSQ